MRDRLEQLMRQADISAMDGGITDYNEAIKANVDYLLANGVIVPPCNVGHKVFYFFETCDEQGKEKTRISEGVVVSFSLQEEGLWAYVRYKSGLTYWHIVDKDFGKTVFLTREEAAKALAEREGKG